MKAKKKLNCWEYMKCGRGPDGDNIKELGVCPAATFKNYNGENSGKNSGRCCWKVAGTFCEGKVQGTFAGKLLNCLKCPFFKHVEKQEGISFYLANSKLL